MEFPDALNDRWQGKRYNAFNRVLKESFGSRVYKVGLRLDFTCPNRDGTAAVGGCIYCNNASHTPVSYQPRTSVADQLRIGTEAIRKRHRAERFIPYFQSYSNTYDSPVRLEKLYREALDFPGVVGLAISTRPDCVGPDIIDLLADIARHTYLWLELGLESIHDRTLTWANRGHGVRSYLDAVERCKARQIRVCTHLIFGFPGETRDDMLAAAPFLNAVGTDGIKVHNLHVVGNTPLAAIFRARPFELFTREEYVALVVDFLERLRPDMIIHRMTGETFRALTVAPDWSVNKIVVHNAINDLLVKRDTWQGKYHDGASVPSAQNREGACL